MQADNIIPWAAIFWAVAEELEVDGGTENKERRYGMGTSLAKAPVKRAFRRVADSIGRTRQLYVGLAKACERSQSAGKTLQRVRDDL